MTSMTPAQAFTALMEREQPHDRPTPPADQFSEAWDVLDRLSEQLEIDPAALRDAAEGAEPGSARHRAIEAIQSTPDLTAEEGLQLIEEASAADARMEMVAQEEARKTRESEALTERLGLPPGGLREVAQEINEAHRKPEARPSVFRSTLAEFDIDADSVAREMVVESAGGISPRA